MVAVDPAMAKLIPVPWETINDADGNQVLAVGEGYIQAALYDLLGLSEEFLREHANCAWFALRISVSALSRLMRTAVLRGFIGGDPSLPLFKEKMLEALASSGAWPEVRPEELEVSPATDFTVAPFDQVKHLEWVENIEVSQLVEGARTKGWGSLLFTMEPCWRDGERWRMHSALVSTCNQWHARCSIEFFPGSFSFPRPAVFALAALTQWNTALEWSEVFVLRASSVNREA
jgi:hypothetical protein